MPIARLLALSPEWGWCTERGRGVRGGNWNSANVAVRSSSRAFWFSQLPTVGFRVARDP